MERIQQGGAMLVPHYVSKAQCDEWVAAIDESHWTPVFDYGDTHGVGYYTEIERGQLGHYHAMAERDNQRRNAIDGLLPTLLRAASEMLPDCGYPYTIPCLPRGIAEDGWSARQLWSNYGIVRARIPLDDPEELSGQITDAGGRPHLDLEGLSPRPRDLLTLETQAYSMVMCLSKPRRGGNLRVWPGVRFTAETQLFNNPATHAEDEAQFASMQPVELHYHAGSVALFDSFCYHEILGSTFTKDRPTRIIAGIHFNLVKSPLPHWEYWF